MSFQVDFLDEDVNPNEVRGEANGPYGKSEVRMNLSQFGGKGTFTAKTVGMHQVRQEARVGFPAEENSSRAGGEGRSCFWLQPFRAPKS